MISNYKLKGSQKCIKNKHKSRRCWNLISILIIFLLLFGSIGMDADIVMAQQEDPTPEATPTSDSEPIPENTPSPPEEPELETTPDTPDIEPNPEPVDDIPLAPIPEEEILNTTEFMISSVQLAPSGLIFTTKPTYEWEPIDQASGYELEIYRGTALAATFSFDQSICTDEICSVLPVKTLLIGSTYAWRIRAYINNEGQEWLPLTGFSVAGILAKTLKPKGNISQPAPTYQWTRTTNTTKYQIEVYKGTRRLFTIYPTNSSCSGIKCQITPNRVLTAASYKWRVRAYANGKWTAWSAYRLFNVIIAVPKPSSPAGTIYVNKPTYSWSRTANATKYQFELYKNRTRLINQFPTSRSCYLNVCKITPNRILAPGTYKWRVRAYVNGSWRSWSAYKYFNTVNPVPRTLSPTGIVYSFNPTFNWSSVTGASIYHYQIFQNGTLRFEEESTAISAAPEFDFEHGSYQWRVRANLPSGWGSFSAFEDFTLSRTVPVPLSPSGFEYHQQPIFSWEEVVGATAYRYDVFQEGTLLFSNEVSSSPHQTNLSMDYGSYQWQIQAFLDGEWLAYSELSDFTIADPIPQNQNPSGTLYTLSTDFSWSPVDGAEEYRLQVFIQGQAEPVLDTSVDTNNFSTSLTPNSYQWHVCTKAGDTWYDYSQTSYFTLIDPIPTLQSPKGTIYTQNPTFSWDAVSGASSYKYEIYKNGVITAQGTTIQTSLTLGTSMAFTDYQWRVQAMANDEWLAFSDLVDFSIAVPIPETYSPAGYIYQQQPSFNWGSVADASSYNLQVYLGESLLIDQQLSGTTFTPENLLDYGNYYWQVRSKIGDDWSAFSEPMLFEVANPIPVPDHPQGFIYTTRPTLSWNAIGGIEKYSFEIYEGSLFLTSEEVEQTFFDLTSDLNFTEHCWRVRAWVVDDWGTYSDCMAFTPVDPIPSLQAPQGNIYSNRPTYAWNTVSGLENYRYQVFQGTTEIFTREVCVTTETPDIPLADGAYRWRVQSDLGDDYGPYSDWMEFTVINPVPLPLAPAGTILKHKPTYNWEPVSGASLYHLEVFQEGNPVFDLTTTETSVTPSTILDLETYTWQVSAYAAGDWHSPSTALTFTVDEPTIERVSISSSGGQGEGVSSNPSISANGRYVTFHSNAPNLVENDTNDYVRDVFVYDRYADETILVSIPIDGTQGEDGASSRPTISADGRYVTFDSYASNLVADDTNNTADIFVRDLQVPSTTRRISLSINGSQGNGTSSNPSISADGRFVAFESEATNLVADDTNDMADIFVHDTQNNTTMRVSVSSDGLQANGISSSPSISADGRYVAFESLASNLVEGGTNGQPHIFVHDMQTGETKLVSRHNDGTQGIGPSASPSISADGHYVAFESDASNLVDGDTLDYFDIFVHDTLSGSTTRISLHSNGTQGNGNSYRPSISADGLYVAFESDASNLVLGDTENIRDIFIHDIQTSTTTRISLDSDGMQGNGTSSSPSISEDGRYVAFGSHASNLVSGDTNGREDIFVYYKRPR